MPLSAAHVIWGAIEDMDSIGGSRNRSVSKSWKALHPDVAFVELDESSDSEQSTADDEEGLATPTYGSSEGGHTGAGSLRSPSWSLGAQEHSLGKCKPCVHYWKLTSCKLGEECDFCHMCTELEVQDYRRQRLRAQKKRKKAERREQRQQQEEVPTSWSTMAAAKQSYQTFPHQGNVRHPEEHGLPTAWVSNLATFRT
mmetsp:Transcript_59518/g.141685  ORF Transcript_59518/g.141685 Transcript_59518/m.141685 type:complete len:198 (-) Transcript_59518:121-714(-)